MWCLWKLTIDSAISARTSRPIVDPAPLQLVAPGVLACGLPLTGIASPLLCHVNLRLNLDSTRINILWSCSEDRDYNKRRLRDLAQHYVHEFLPACAQYVTSNDPWPLVPVSLDGPIGYLVQRVLQCTIESKVFPCSTDPPPQGVKRPAGSFERSMAYALRDRCALNLFIPTSNFCCLDDCEPRSAPADYGG